MRKSILTAVILVAGTLLTLSGCGGQSSQPVTQVASGSAEVASASPSSPPSPSGPSEATLNRFFTALASDESAKIKPVLKLAEPGSVAYAYADYLYLRALAEEGAGDDADPQSIEHVGSAWKACPDSKDQGSCITWSDVQASGDLIANYTANGKRLDDRIALGSSKKYNVGSIATAEVILSYKSVQSGTTFIVLKMHNGGQKSVFADDSAYQTRNGKQVGIEGVEAPSTLLPESQAYAVLSVANAPLGGTIYLSMFTTGGQSADASAMIPTA